MLGFFSKKRSHNQKLLNHVKSNCRSYSTNKHLIQCKVILLDGTDLSVDLPVSNTYCTFIGENVLFKVTYSKNALQSFSQGRTCGAERISYCTSAPEDGFTLYKIAIAIFFTEYFYREKDFTRPLLKIHLGRFLSFTFPWILS